MNPGSYQKGIRRLIWIDEPLREQCLIWKNDNAANTTYRAA